MHRRFLTTIAWLSLLNLCHAGNVIGVVRAEGKEGAEAEGGGGKYESRKFKFTERVDYGAMHDFVVCVVGPLSGDFKPPQKPVRVITQKDATFSPHVLPILAGTTVEWPNKDDILHNAFSISDSNPFDLGLYKNETQTWTFKTPGTVDVFCSIHTAMHCVILVFDNPYFAATDGKGNYSIKGIPAGTYKLKAWRERMPPLVKEVTIPLTGDVRADFVLTIGNLPKAQ